MNYKHVLLNQLTFTEPKRCNAADTNEIALLYEQWEVLRRNEDAQQANDCEVEEEEQEGEEVNVEVQRVDELEENNAAQHEEDLEACKTHIDPNAFCATCMWSSSKK